MVRTKKLPSDPPKYFVSLHYFCFAALEYVLFIKRSPVRRNAYKNYLYVNLVRTKESTRHHTSACPAGACPTRQPPSTVPRKKSSKLPIFYNVNFV